MIDPVFVFEAAAVGLALLTALVSPRAGAGWFGAAERWFGALALHRGRAILLAALLPLALRALLLPVFPPPLPFITDEYSHLLIADTIAEGRISNPAHPMWVHFETLHVLPQPAYASMYPPAQGVLMGIGQAITGHPWAGVWMAVAAMCAATAWMLYGWLPPRWALFGAALAALHFGVLTYWMNSYWGGAVAAAGGSLALGALPRLRRRPMVRDALLLGLGLAALANTRPYEGFLLSLPVFAALAYAFFLRTRAMLAPAMALAAILGVTTAGMAVYNRSVTGDWRRMPYELNRQTYGWPQTFVWQPAIEAREYRHPEFLEYYLWERTRHDRHPASSIPGKVRMFWAFLIGPALTLPFVFLPCTLRDRRVRFLLAAAAVVGAGYLGYGFFFPHYAAPVMGLTFVVLVQCARRMRLWRFRRAPVGVFLVRAMPVLVVAVLGARAIAGPLSELDFYRLAERWPPLWFASAPVATERSRIEAALAASPGRHLVFVRYCEGHEVHHEWVYNRSNIDGAKVVWARSMGADRDRKLMRYFEGRSMWIVEPDRIPARLARYAPAEAAVRTSGAR